MAHRSTRSTRGGGSRLVVPHPPRPGRRWRARPNSPHRCAAATGASWLQAGGGGSEPPPPRGRAAIARSLARPPRKQRRLRPGQNAEPSSTAPPALPPPGLSPRMVGAPEAREDVAEAAVPVELGLALGPLDGALQLPAEEALRGEADRRYRAGPARAGAGGGGGGGGARGRESRPAAGRRAASEPGGDATSARDSPSLGFLGNHPLALKKTKTQRHKRNGWHISTGRGEEGVAGKGPPPSGAGCPGLFATGGRRSSPSRTPPPDLGPGWERSWPWNPAQPCPETLADPGDP